MVKMTKIDKERIGGEMKKFTLKTREGSARLFAIFLALVLVFSFCARLMSTDGGDVKISKVAIDSRGAIIDADLYYPAGTSDRDKLPAVLVAHGGGVEKGVAKGMSDELARRGFVVLNVNAYGVAASEQPVYDEAGQGIDGFNNQLTPSGMYDALNFIRTLHFVDQERIGMTGHSMGSRRTARVAMMDCGYESLNDMMINFMYEELGQTFTAEEIKQDANELAKARLNEDQLKHYNAVLEEKTAHYNTRIKSILMLGSDAAAITPMETVTVAGHEVLRNCQVNYGVLSGLWDYNYRAYPTTDVAKAGWHTGGEDIVGETWYIIDDVNDSSVKVGLESEVSVLENADFAAAIEARTTRIHNMNRETHSKNFFSNETTTDVVKYFEQTLRYNGGELGSADAKPIDSENMIFMWRETFNLLAMVAMVCMLIAFAGILVKTEYFKPCEIEVPQKEAKPFSIKRFAIFSILGIVIEFIAIHMANGVFVPGLPNIPLLPFFPSWWLTFIFIGILGIGSIITLVAYKVMDKGEANFAALNFKLKLGALLKTVLMGVILMILAYMTLVVVMDLFNMDFRFWMAVFAEMKTEYWRYVWRFAICMVPFFLLIGASTNYSIRTDIPQWQDTLITVVVNSLGVYLCCLVNYLMLTGADTLWSTFISTYGMLVIVPVTVYITRKMYLVTKSIWLGALVNSLLVAWSFCSAMGLNCMMYNAQGWLSIIFNV